MAEELLNLISEVEEVILTPEQEQLIINEWNGREANNPPSIQQLIKLVFNNGEDGRSKYGKTIKAFLGKDKKKAKVNVNIKKEDVELTTEQKEYISNNCATQKPLEMVRILFKNDKLQPVSMEGRAVIKYLKSLSSQVQFNDPNNYPTLNYEPPNSIDKIFNRIKTYTDANWVKDKLTPSQKKNIQSLMGYLHTYRFIGQINSYQKQEERNLFESSFVRFTYDKNDLTEEDVDQYIILATEVVMSVDIQKTINQLQREQDNVLEMGEKMSGNLVEAVNVARTEYNSSVARQQKLFKALNEDRSARLKDKLQTNASILNLVEMWKAEETRKRMIAIAEKRKEKLSEAIDDLSNMDDLIAKINGVDKFEILNG